MKKIPIAVIALLLLLSVPAGAVPFMVGNTQTLLDAGFENPWAMKDQTDEVNTLIDLWNGGTTDPIPLPEAIDLTPGSEYTTLNGYDVNDVEFKSGTYTIPEGIAYVSFKYDGQNPGAGFELWYVLGEAGNTIDFGPWPYALSHYDEWGPTSVPEAGTLLFLGTGLIGLAGLGRKKLVK